MQGVFSVKRFAMAWARIVAAQHVQPRLAYPLQELLPGAQSQMFCQVRKDQPPFAFGGQMCAQTSQITAQHGGIFVVHGLLQRTAGATR